MFLPDKLLGVRVMIGDDMKIGSDHAKPHFVQDVGKQSELAEDMTQKGKVSVAEHSWNGRFISSVETGGVFKEYGIKATGEKPLSNQLSAEHMWRSQVVRYGVENARQGLELLSPRFGGSGELKARHGLIEYADAGQNNTMSCGNIQSILRRTGVEEE